MSTASTFEQEMLALINEERTSRGLNPLQLETQLNDSAEDHSTWMLDTDTFSHTGAGGSSATERMRDAGFDFTGSWRSGENIAWQSERGPEGISDDVEQLHQSLMDSPGHRANILNPDYEYIGIGIEEGEYNGWDAVMVTQNFATTDAEVMLDSGVAPTPPTDVIAEPEEPVVQEPVEDTPDTDVTETEEPVEETPDIDVTETEDPVEETPDTDVTETEDPVEETEITETNNPAGDCFDVEAFLAAIDDFVNDLLVLVDDFRMNPYQAPEKDDFRLTWNKCDDTPVAPEVASDADANQMEWEFVSFSYSGNCMMDFV
ncbi:CAP domain-containing protein [Ruegeria sp. SCP11]|uniref:CAP domain-containing protein n=1 Tax=Ruegeria sp. SCP11 TaxID=3141378 RepID=UPI00333C1AEC